MKWVFGRIGSKMRMTMIKWIDGVCVRMNLVAMAKRGNKKQHIEQRKWTAHTRAQTEQMAHEWKISDYWYVKLWNISISLGTNAIRLTWMWTWRVAGIMMFSFDELNSIFQAKKTCNLSIIYIVTHMPHQPAHLRSSVVTFEQSHSSCLPKSNKRHRIDNINEQWKAKVAIPNFKATPSWIHC